MFLRLGFLLLALAVLGSCASLSEEECRVGDWFQIGVDDGAEGRGLSRIEAHRRACKDVGVTPDTEAWLAGRERGLRAYCVPARAYAVGRSGFAIASGCTAEERAAMAPAYETGRRWHDIGLRIDDVEDDIDEIDRELAALPADASAQRAALLSRRSLLISRIGLLRLERMRYDSWY